MSDLPKYHETFLPILEVLKDGKILHYNDLRKKVRDRYYGSLSNEQLALKTKSGDPLILNRIGWGKAYLKQAKMIHQPERAMVQITEKGKGVLKRGSLSLEELINDSDFQAHRKKQQVKTEFAKGESSTASPQDLVDTGIQEIEEQVKADLLDRLKQIDPYYFERVILQLFHKMGYGEFFETAKSGDGGIDGIINQDQLGLEKIYVQAKRYTENKVREKDIRNFIGAMNADTLKGIFVTTSSFDDAAITKAHDARHSIILIDGKHLTDLMYKYEVGIQVSDTYKIKSIDEDFFEDGV